MNLYQITEEQRTIINQIELLEGEITEEIEESLKITENQLQSKSIAYLSVIRNKESFNDTIDAEIKRLQGLKKTNLNTINRLKDTLLYAVRTFGKYEVGTNKFGIRKSSSISIDDIKNIPENYKTIKTTETANKVELKKALKSGEKIEGVYIVENENLKIN